MDINEQRLFDHLQNEYSHNFSGWDFTYLSDSGRMYSSPLPWNYQSLIEAYYKNSNSLLDLGTGGGEFLSSLKGLPPKTFATEGYEPNIPIAKKRLGQIGIEVRKIENDNIPFDSDSFDLVINRHESYKESEIRRVLSNDGIFITQQVGGLNTIDLNMWMNAEIKPPSNWCLCTMVQKLEREGFKIEYENESINQSRFFDIGAVVFYLKCIPWQIGDFSLNDYWERIYQLARYIQQNKYIDFIQHRYIIIATK